MHVRRRTADANSTGAMLEPDQRDRQASVFVRECLMAHGGSLDPSHISDKAMCLVPDDERTYSKFNRLFEPGALNVSDTNGDVGIDGSFSLDARLCQRMAQC